jgi:hypothetical protein
MRNYVPLTFLVLWLQWGHAQSFKKGELLFTDSTHVSAEIASASPSHGGPFDGILVRIHDSIQFLGPNQLLGFHFGKKSFRRLELKLDKKTSYIFAEELQKGPAHLYYYEGKALDQKDFYIFWKKGESAHYMSITPLLKSQTPDGNITTAPMDLSMAQQMNKLIQNCSDEKTFQQQFIRYFSDCPGIVNKLKQEWYTPSSISIVFQDYNRSCGSKNDVPK